MASRDVVPLLLSAGANVNAATPGNGWTALMTALYSGSLACVQALFKAGADVDCEEEVLFRSNPRASP